MSEKAMLSHQKDSYIFEKTSDILSPEEFLGLNDNERMNIATSKIIPPDLDKPGFGFIKIKYRLPKFAI